MQKIDLFLPISKDCIASILDSGGGPELLTGLSVPEICALRVVQGVSRQCRDGFDVRITERVLSELIQVAVEFDEKAKLVREIAGSIDLDEIGCGFLLLDYCGIGLLTQVEVDKRDYLTGSGLWRFGFEKIKKAQDAVGRYVTTEISGNLVSLSDSQARRINELRSNVDDHFHLQGYAGTGKTELLNYIVEVLIEKGVTPASILVLAQTRAQRGALSRRLGARKKGISLLGFGDLAKLAIPEDLTRRDYWSAKRRRSRNTFDFEAFVQAYEIKPVGGLSPAKVADIAWNTVSNFCHSSDCEISLQHLPSWVFEHAINYAVGEIERSVLLYLSLRLWKEVVRPERVKMMVIREYHRVKFAALEGVEIPARYSHVIIDESHDLAAPMLQILDHSHETVVITLGDEFQSLNGLPEKRQERVRQRNMVESERSGKEIELLINPIIQAHPSDLNDPFKGHPDKLIVIDYYDSPKIPYKPAVLLAADEWGVFEWVQRLAKEKVEVQFLGWLPDLDLFVQSLIELYKNNVRPRHGALSKFVSKYGVEEAALRSKSIARVSRLLNQGYGYSDWAETKSFLVNGHGRKSYSVGKVSDSKNQQFDTVMLTPDVMNKNWAIEAMRDRYSSELYVAVTRAKKQLIVPIELRYWVEDNA